MVTPAKAAANRAWDKANMVNLCCRVRREYADRVRACCAAQGDSVNAVIRAALDAYLEEHEEGSGSAEE